MRSKEQETDFNSLIYKKTLSLGLNNIHVAPRVARLQRQALGVGVEAHDRWGRPRGWSVRRGRPRCVDSGESGGGQSFPRSDDVEREPQRFVVAGRRGRRWDRSSPRQDCLDGARR